MPIPRGTRQLVALREVAERLGTTLDTTKHWWRSGHLVGRLTEGRVRRRVTIPIEVVEFYLRYHRLPSKLDLYQADVLSREYLLELSGPDGGLAEHREPNKAAAMGARAGAASESGRLLLLRSP